MGHPLKKGEEIFWLQFIRAFFRSLWLERNNSIFNDKVRPLLDPEIGYEAMIKLGVQLVG